MKKPLIRTHDLVIETESRTVKRNGKAVLLTKREYELLELLARHKGRTVSRTLIWKHLYDEYDENTSNVIDVYIRYLRKKIDANADVKLIVTRRGSGYMLKADKR